MHQKIKSLTETQESLLGAIMAQLHGCDECFAMYQSKFQSLKHTNSADTVQKNIWQETFEFSNLVHQKLLVMISQFLGSKIPSPQFFSSPTPWQDAIALSVLCSCTPPAWVKHWVETSESDSLSPYCAGQIIYMAYKMKKKCFSSFRESLQHLW